MENTINVNLNVDEKEVKKVMRKEIFKTILEGVVYVGIDSIIGSLFKRFIPKQSGFKGKVLEVGKYAASGIPSMFVADYISGIIDEEEDE